MTDQNRLIRLSTWSISYAAAFILMACAPESRGRHDVIDGMGGMDGGIGGMNGGSGGGGMAGGSGGTGGMRNGGMGGAGGTGGGGMSGGTGGGGMAGMSGGNGGTMAMGGSGGGAGGSAGEDGMGGSGGGTGGDAGEDGAAGEDGGGMGGSGMAGGTGGSTATGKPPSKFVPALPLFKVGNRMAYNPHRNYPFTLQGSGHVHCGESGGPTCTQQMTLLRDLAGGHKHDFVWMTPYERMAPDPNVNGILYMFGVEVYGNSDGVLNVGASAHIVALLPEGALQTGVMHPLPPVGTRFRPWPERLTAIADAGGLSVIAHPNRGGFPLSAASTVAASAPDDLWGIELILDSTTASDAQTYLDARLGAGKYVCLSGGNDINGQEYLRTRGYQVVSLTTASPTRAQLFAEVKACNFFACGSSSVSSQPFTNPSLKIEDEEIVFSIGGNPDTIEFIGSGGTVLHMVSGESTARYQPPATEPYVRVRARRNTGGAQCFSQAVWFVD